MFFEKCPVFLLERFDAMVVALVRYVIANGLNIFDALTVKAP